MHSAKFLALAFFLVGVSAETGPDEKVKAAFVDGLREIHASSRLIEGYEKGWDGSLPDTVGGLRPILEKVGHSEQEIQALLDLLENVVKNKDNPSWKTHYGNMFIKVGGADKSFVEKLEQHAPDTIPTDVNVAKEALKKIGLHEEHAEGHAKIAVWLSKVHV